MVSLEPSNHVLLSAFDEAATEFSEVDALRTRIEGDRYTDLELIGEGGAKLVYACLDKVSGREMVRAYPRSEDRQEDFLREALLHAQLEHSNIIPLYDLGYVDGRPYFCMQRISGMDLEAWLKGQHSLSEKLDVLLKVADAVSFAHERDVLHLDIKPGNIQLSKHGEVFVGDWGLARANQTHFPAVKITETNRPCAEKGEGANQTQDTFIQTKQATGQFTRHGFVSGTPGFMAPEQCVKGEEKDERTDVYGLGSLLFFMLCGAPTVKGDVQEGFEKVLRGDIDFEQVPVGPRLMAILKKSLSVKRELRYQSIVEMQSDIQAYRDGALTSVDRSSFSLLVLSLWKRKKAVIIPSFLGILLLVSVSAAYVVNLRGAEREARDAEGLARDAEKEAVKSAQQAKQALFDLAEEKDEKQRGFEEAAKNYLRESISRYIDGSRGYYSYDTKTGKKAYDLVVKALNLQPENKEAWALRGKLEILIWRLHDAAASFEKAGEEFVVHKEACVEFAKLKKGETRRIVEFLYKLLPSTDMRLIHDVMYQVIFSLEERDLDDFIYFVEESLNMRNGGGKQRLHFQFDKENMALDMSHNTQLRYIFMIKRLPIRELNISHTIIGKDLKHLERLPLTKLNASYTHMDDTTLPFLKGKGITHLNLEGTMITGLSELDFLPLQHLNIANTPIRDFSFLRHYSLLEELVCNQRDYEKVKQYISPDVKVRQIPY